MICKQCKKHYHHCGSCGRMFPQEDSFCSIDCYKKFNKVDKKFSALTKKLKKANAISECIEVLNLADELLYEYADKLEKMKND